MTFTSSITTQGNSAGLGHSYFRSYRAGHLAFHGYCIKDSSIRLKRQPRRSADLCTACLLSCLKCLDMQDTAWEPQKSFKGR